MADIKHITAMLNAVQAATLLGQGRAHGTDRQTPTAEAQHFYTSLQMRFVDMARGARGYMKPPIDDIEQYWSGPEKHQAQRMLACSFVGSPETLRRDLTAFMTKTGADELMVATAVYDHGARLKSYELLAGV